MSTNKDFNPAEQRIEEIRAIRHRLFGTTGADLANMRELASHVPAGFKVLDDVRAVVPLSVQLDRDGGRKAS
jgi:hypothetical protein